MGSESLLIEKGTIVTVDSSRRVIRGCDIAIEKDRIVDLGRSLRKVHKTDRVIDATDKLVLPGLIDSHTHFVCGLDKGLMPEVTLTGKFMERLVRYLENLTQEDIYYSTLILGTEMIKNGTTSFLDNGSLYPDQVVKAINELGLRGVVGRWTGDSPNFPNEGTVEAELKGTQRFVERYASVDGGRIRGWVTLLGTPGMSCSDELLVGAKKIADRYGVGMNMHAASSMQEVKTYLSQKGCRPIEHLGALGILDSNVSLIHMVCVDDKEIDLLRKHSVNVIHCPSAGLFLAKGLASYGKFPEMIEKGVNVCLGSDSSDSSNFHDMVREMFLASTLYRDIRQKPEIMGAQKAIEMATINGAKTLLAGNELGSIETGKKADILIFDLKRPEWVPLYNEVYNLVYSASGDSVETVIVDGKIVMQNRKLTDVDESEIISKAQELGIAVLNRSKEEVSLRAPWHYS